MTDETLLLCEAFGLDDLASDPAFKTNNDRVTNKDKLLPVIKDTFKRYTKADLMAKLEKTGLPFAPITRPEDLFDDAHLNASGGLVDVTVPDGEFKGTPIRLPALPLEMNGQRFGAHLDVPRVGQYTKEVLTELGYSAAEIAEMIAAGAVGAE